MHPQRHIRPVRQTPRRPQPFLQHLDLPLHLLQSQYSRRDVLPRLVPIHRHAPQDFQLVLGLREFSAVAAEFRPDGGEDLVAGRAHGVVVAVHDVGDGEEALFEGLQELEQGLGFFEEAVDFVFDFGCVEDVDVEEGGVGELDGLEGVEEVVREPAGEVGAVGGGFLFFGVEVVEGALGPAAAGQDGVAGAADVGVEFLERVDRLVGRVDEVVDFEEEFLFGGNRCDCPLYY